MTPKKTKRDPASRTQQLAVRLPVELVERIEKHVPRMKRRSPGMLATRAAALRDLLVAGLDAVEKHDQEHGSRALDRE